MKGTRGQGRSVAAPPDFGSRREATGSGRDPGYAELAEALSARKDDILRESQSKYRDALGSVEPDSPLWNVISLATLSIVRWLRTGERANGKDRSTIASLGEAAAQHRDVVAQKLAETIGNAARPSTAGPRLYAVPDEPPDDDVAEGNDGAHEGTVERANSGNQRN